MQEQVTACALCGRRAEVRLRDAFDDRYGSPGHFTIERCTGCGHGRVSSELPVEKIRRIYTDYYPRASCSVAEFRPRVATSGITAWLDGDRRLAHTWVPPGVRILDIGCGFGETLAYHRARGCDAHGVEADQNVRRVAEALGLQVQIGLFDPDHYPEASFDWVTMDQVLEHMRDPVQTLRGVARILRRGGSAVVSTPNAGGWGARVFGRRWINWHVPYHQQFFTRRSLEIASGLADLRVVRCETLTSSAWLGFQWAHLATYRGIGSASPFWSRSVRAAPRERLALAALSLLHRSRVNHVLTRIFDGVGIGDNLLFVLRKP